MSEETGGDLLAVAISEYLALEIIGALDDWVSDHAGHNRGLAERTRDSAEEAIYSAINRKRKNS